MEKILEAAGRVLAEVSGRRHLIAHAWELLETTEVPVIAVQKYVPDFRAVDWPEWQVAAARAVIAKAKGEQ